MKKFTRCLKSIALVTGLLTASVQAAVISGTSFGSAPAGFDSTNITFGGSGIPNNLLTFFTATTDNDTLLFALTAHQRFSSPTVTTDGAGTYFAAAGNCSGSNCADTPRAAWNFAWFVGSQNGSNLLDIGLTSLTLRYDTDASTSTDFGTINLLEWLGLSQTSNITQGSQNMTFGFLFDSMTPGITAPQGTFDRNLDGEYRFVLEASFNNDALGTAAIDVVVGDGAVDVPAPAPLALLGLGVLGLALRRRQM